MQYSLVKIVVMLGDFLGLLRLRGEMEKATGMAIIFSARHFLVVLIMIASRHAIERLPCLSLG